jgi:hypothetical protein
MYMLADDVARLALSLAAADSRMITRQCFVGAGSRRDRTADRIAVLEHGEGGSR